MLDRVVLEEIVIPDRTSATVDNDILVGIIAPQSVCDSDAGRFLVNLQPGRLTRTLVAGRGKESQPGRVFLFRVMAMM